MATSHRGVSSIAVVPASVETALRRTMVLGLPIEEAHRPTFYFDREVDWERHDAEGSPWDWETAPTSESQRAPVQTICAIEFFSPLGRQGAFPTEVGDFNPTSLVCTFLQRDFVEVYGCSKVEIGPEPRTFTFRFWRPAIALGGLGVYQVHMVGA